MKTVNSLRCVSVIGSLSLLAGCATTDPGGTQSAAMQGVGVAPVYRTATVAHTNGISGEALAKHHYTAGRAAWSASDVHSARRHFAAALRADPNHADSMNGMALVLSALGRHEESLAMIQHAIKRAPGEPMYARNAERIAGFAAAGTAAQLEPARPTPLVSTPAVVSLSSGSTEPTPVVGTTPSGLSISQLGPNVYALNWPQPAATAALSVPRAALTPGQAKPVDVARETFDRSVGFSATGNTPARRAPPTRERSASGEKHAMVRVAATAPDSTGLPARVLVVNGMGRTGWAAHNARLLAEAGFASARVANHTDFKQTHTIIQFRRGHEAAAKRLQKSLPSASGAMLVESTDLPEGLDLRVVLGHDSGPRRLASL